eukprot:GHRQ01034851.1.p1 GENE.GHRQ01034851.1~~GHRQ01034851.1.p1  ORF type:complete len:173 (+),score=31.03 GHRQ01034851.1:14-532(+)
MYHAAATEAEHLPALLLLPLPASPALVPPKIAVGEGAARAEVQRHVDAACHCQVAPHARAAVNLAQLELLAPGHCKAGVPGHCRAIQAGLKHSSCAVGSREGVIYLKREWGVAGKHRCRKEWGVARKLGARAALQSPASARQHDGALPSCLACISPEALWVADNAHEGSQQL